MVGVENGVRAARKHPRDPPDTRERDTVAAGPGARPVNLQIGAILAIIATQKNSG